MSFKKPVSLDLAIEEGKKESKVKVNQSRNPQESNDYDDTTGAAGKGRLIKLKDKERGGGKRK